MPDNCGRCLTMAVTPDDSPKFQQYAHPDRLVSTDWLAARIDDGSARPGGDIVVVESDEDVLLYDTGHIPGSVKVDWHNDLNDPLTRDYVDGQRFAEVLGERGIGRDTTVVVYGDKSNWWAAYALWVFSPVRARGRAAARRRPGQVGRRGPRADPRGAQARAGGLPRRGALGHARSARSRTTCWPTSASPWWTSAPPASTPASCCTCPTTRRRGRCAAATSPARGRCRGPARPPRTARSRQRADLEAIYLTEQGLRPDDDVVAYCRIGERSSHTWFVLTHLLGFATVRNYDGSWTEWGNAVRVPIEPRRADGAAGSRERRQRPGGAAGRPGRDRGGLHRGRPRASGWSCCWSSATSCRACPSASPGARSCWSRWTSASPRLPGGRGRAAGRRASDAVVHLFFSAPAEAPTTRGFAGILHEGLDGLTRR